MAERILVTFLADHPAFAGHFPGAPVVPGVLLLDELLCALAADCHLPYTAFCVQSVKFLSPVRPGDQVCWAYNERSPDMVDFRLSVGGRDMVIGTVAVEIAS
ncbi:MAG: hypothetical protein ACYDEV_10520 [Acidiferrobacter sp.]